MLFCPPSEWFHAALPMVCFGASAWSAWAGYCYFSRNTRQKEPIYCRMEPKAFIAINAFWLFIGLGSWQQYRRVEARQAHMAESNCFRGIFHRGYQFFNSTNAR